VLSAIVGFIVLSAFSVSDTPGEAVRRILEKPNENMEQKQKLDLIRVEKEHEATLAKLQKEKDIEALRIQQKTEIIMDKHDTNVKLKEIDSRTNSQLATIKYNSSDRQKEEDNKMLIAISILAFILIYIYLKYQRTLAQDELEKEKEYKDMLAKKEYAERILAIVATGNISLETEHKLLKMLDELNNPQIHTRNPNGQIGRHPNPDIEQLPLQRNN
jgi:flagellar biosynthesis component FlhA